MLTGHGHINSYIDFQINILPSPRSILLNQGMTEVLPVLLPTAPLGRWSGKTLFMDRPLAACKYTFQVSHFWVKQP